MAIEFLVESGEGLATATSYVSVAEMQQYWENLGYDFSELTDANIQVLLNNATRVLDNYYFRYWVGSRLTTTQRLEWPRYGAYYVDGQLIDSDTIPIELKDALCELAYVAHSGINLQPNVSAEGVAVEAEDKVDVIKQYRKYLKESIKADGRHRWTAVEDALKRLISFNSGVSIRRV